MTSRDTEDPRREQRQRRQHNPVQVFTTPPADLVDLLKQHVPHSLPLLRRLQFTRFPGGITEYTRILFASSSVSSSSLVSHSKGKQDGDVTKDGKDGDLSAVSATTVAAGSSSPSSHPAFAAAYVDFSRSPETEVWMYSSLESRRHRDEQLKDDEEEEEEEEEGEEADLAVAVLREIKTQRDAYARNPDAVPKREREEVLMGTFSERVRLAVIAATSRTRTTTTGCSGDVARGVDGMDEEDDGGKSGGGVGGGGSPGSGTVNFPYVELYDKWLMRVDQLPQVPASLGIADDGTDAHGDVNGEEGLHWTQVRREDIAMVLSRSNIPRKERTIVLLPSMAIAKRDGTLVAWAFLGPDSSLSSLHCEPEYRGKGLAKAVAVKIFKEHLARYGDDGYCWADVSPGNKASQGVCKSLGAEAAWQCSWTRIDLDKSFPNI